MVRSAKYGSTTGHRLSILLTDQLGTATTAVDEASGRPVTRRFSKPFGETRGSQPSSWPDRRSYLRTGIDDTATGLTHLGAREYDQSTGRCLSADPVIDPSDPLQINGYAYADNDPVAKSDPDGLQAIECWRARRCAAEECRSRRSARPSPGRAGEAERVSSGWSRRCR
ncbi:RHS repeat-associated core domain-containing protein [Streptomyces sp. NPDC007157]|uniref:RHS repeat-associated core domain-containing protein n=1 Tax=Streptomyces sp. NPDC007157 TaxID=3154681 RepID=UPI0033EE5113